MNRIPLLVPHMPSAREVLPYLEQIDDNRHYTNFGPLNRRLEARLIEDMGLGTHAITTVSNCTAGLELALQALDLPAGARVLIPAITFVATATAVVRTGLVPVIADVDPASWVLTPAIAHACAAEKRIAAVMPVSTFGYAHDPAGWDAFTGETGIPVVIDAAGAYGNQLPGATTDVVYSFHATKSLGAGEGGAIVSASAGRIARARVLANFGIDTRCGLLAEWGTNAKMSEYHCAVALAALDAWEQTKSARRALHRDYLQRLGERIPALVQQEKSPDGVYPLMPVLLPAGHSATRVAEALAADGIETRRWYCPALSKHPALDGAEQAGALEVSLDIGERILGLPFHVRLEPTQVERVVDRLAHALSANGVER